MQLINVFHEGFIRSLILFTFFIGKNIRYVFAVISGWIFFGEWAWEGWNPLAYSLAYNAIYIFAEAAVTIVVLLLPPVRDLMVRLKNMATGN